MDLLTAQDRINIRGALQNVIDTFMKTPIIFHVINGFGGDHMEDLDPSETNYNITGYVEYPDEVAKTDESGNTYLPDVKVSLGLDDMDGIGLIAPDTICTLRAGIDEMTVNGERFFIKFVGVEGAFEQLNILVNIIGERKTQKR